MSVITPSETAAQYLASLTIGQQRFDLSEQSDSNGHTATRLGGPPRWRLAMSTLAAMEPAVSALWKAIAVQLRGRVNHLAMWDITQPAPRGTARGTLLTSGTTAAGATSAAITGAVATPNLLRGGSFEIDSDANGRADNWTAYSIGTTGAITYGLSSVVASSGAFAQRVSASGLGTASSDIAGLYQTITAAELAGLQVVFSADIAVYDGTPDAELLITWRNGGSTVRQDSLLVDANGTLTRYSLAVTAPTGITAADCFIYMHSRSSSVGLAVFDVDAAQLEIGSSATAFAVSPTLKAGDWLQIGAGAGTSHLCMVTADATANDAGAMTVAFEPPTRIAFSSGAAVTWDKPVGYYKQAPDSLSWSGAAGSSDVGGFAFDMIEDWRA